MTRISVLYWQNIPTVVEARDSNGIKKIELSKRFSELIDIIAMKKELADSDHYLQYWKKKKLPASENSAKECILEISNDFESRFSEIKEKALYEAFEG